MFDEAGNLVIQEDSTIPREEANVSEEYTGKKPLGGIYFIA